MKCQRDILWNVELVETFEDFVWHKSGEFTLKMLECLPGKSKWLLVVFHVEKNHLLVP